MDAKSPRRRADQVYRFEARRLLQMPAQPNTLTALKRITRWRDRQAGHSAARKTTACVRCGGSGKPGQPCSKSDLPAERGSCGKLDLCLVQDIRHSRTGILRRSLRNRETGKRADLDRPVTGQRAGRKGHW